MAKSGLTLNTAAAVRDFKIYDTKVHIRFDKDLDNTAKAIKENQISILRANVKEWTGNLADSIEITSKDDEREIGPTASYAKWIEDGGKGGFEGYQYIKNSIRPEQRSFNRKIKRSLERS